MFYNYKYFHPWKGFVSPVREEGQRKVHVLLQAQRRAHQELQTLYLMQDENQVSDTTVFLGGGGDLSLSLHFNIIFPQNGG